MDTITAIKTRRSIRRYKDTAVPENMITGIIEAGMYAPSAANEQPWQFIVVDEKNFETYESVVKRYAVIMKQVPVGIVVCGDLSLEKSAGNWILDCSAAIQNMLLAAHASGLGAVWIGIYPCENAIKGIQAHFSLPDHIIPAALVPLGYPDKVPAGGNRFREERIHYFKWNRSEKAE